MMSGSSGIGARRQQERDQPRVPGHARDRFHSALIFDTQRKRSLRRIEAVRVLSGRAQTAIELRGCVWTTI